MAREQKNRQPAKTGTRGQGGASSNAAAPPARKKSLNPLKFFSEVRQEGRKVTWTSRQETIVSSIMVVIMAIIAAIFFFLVDTVIGLLIDFLLGLGGGA
jgi:preprotein translocase subunit SecE